ncbi:MAG: hypothetical protein ACXWTP_04625 [Methylosarcina sp.]
MRILKIFLASSSELRNDREQFEIFINRRNKIWVEKGIFLKLIIWEDFIDALSQTRLQDEYNKAIRDCDLFVMLFFTKVGKYTEEEFETAFGSYKETDKPLIFTYFKDPPSNTGSANENDLISLRSFQEKLKKLGHFQTRYESINDLLLHFGQQLDKLADSGFIQLHAKIEDAVNPPITQTHYGTGDNVAGNQTKIGRQVNMGSNSTYNENNSKD